MKRFILLSMFATMFCVPLLAQHPAGMDPRESIQQKDTLDGCCPEKTAIKIRKVQRDEIAGSELMMSSKEKMKRQVVKIYTCAVHNDLMWDKPGRCSECNALLNRSAKEQMKMDVMHYSCPRHPEVKGKKGTECAQCGLGLKIKSASSTSYNGQACVNRSKSGKCRSCGTDRLRSPKEKMKMDVMKVCCCPNN